MMDPEYYLGAFKGPDGKWVATKFSDTADVRDLSEESMKVRAHTLGCSVPPATKPCNRAVWRSCLNAISQSLWASSCLKGNMQRRVQFLPP